MRMSEAALRLFQKPNLFTLPLTCSTQCSYCCSLYRITHFLYMAVSCGDGGSYCCHMLPVRAVADMLRIHVRIYASPCPPLLICCFLSFFFFMCSLFLSCSCVVVQLGVIFREKKVCVCVCACRNLM